MPILTICGNSEAAMIVSYGPVQRRTIEQFKTVTGRSIARICDYEPEPQLGAMIDWVDEKAKEGKPINEKCSLYIKIFFEAFCCGWNAYIDKCEVELPQMKMGDVLQQWTADGTKAETIDGHALGAFSVSMLQQVLTIAAEQKDEAKPFEFECVAMKNCIGSFLADGWNAAQKKRKELAGE